MRGKIIREGKVRQGKLGSVIKQGQSLRTGRTSSSSSSSSHRNKGKYLLHVHIHKQACKSQSNIWQIGKYMQWELINFQRGERKKTFTKFFGFTSLPCCVLGFVCLGVCLVVCVILDYIASGFSSAEAVFYLALDVLVLKRFAVTSKATSPRKHFSGTTKLC